MPKVLYNRKADAGNKMVTLAQKKEMSTSKVEDSFDTGFILIFHLSRSSLDRIIVCEINKLILTTS